jgi:hypothetical protein
MASGPGGSKSLVWSCKLVAVPLTTRSERMNGLQKSEKKYRPCNAGSAQPRYTNPPVTEQPPG